MLTVGTKVKYGEADALIVEVDNRDPLLPYRILLVDESFEWVRADEISWDIPLYTISESDVEGVDVNIDSDGMVVSDEFSAMPSINPPSELRELADEHIKLATHTLAVARYMEANDLDDPDKRAREIYYEAYPPGWGYLSWDQTDPSRRDMARKLAVQE